MEHRVYLAGDVDAIKDYVFETSSLPQIRGGSELLQKCEDAIKRDLKEQYGYEVIYCAGGSFLLEVPADQAANIKKVIEGLYRDTTLVATVTIVYEDGWGAPDAPPPPAQGLNGWARRLVKAARADNEFGRRIAVLAARMREAKRASVSAPFFQALPFGRRCDRCGKRMVALPPCRIGDDQELLCLVCKKRLEQGRGHQEDDQERDIRGKFNRKFWEKYKGDISAKQPRDLDALVQDAPRRYLALLYADGNDIGRLLAIARAREEYEALSDALSGATEEALYRALYEVCGKALQDKERCWPFDIVNIGGDDVTVLVQAGYAWEVGVRFLKGFEEEMARRLGERWLRGGAGRSAPVTACCGIVIADVRYPIRYMAHLAEGLLRQAKREAKRVGKESSASTLTFLWLTAPVAADTVESLWEQYRHPGDGRRASLVARPYSLAQAEELTAHLGQIARWPRGLRHRWAEALGRGVMLSTSLIAYDLARRREDERRKMCEILEKLASLAGSEAEHRLAPPIWAYQRRDGYDAAGSGPRTALLDALELAELYSMRPEHQAEEDL